MGISKDAIIENAKRISGDENAVVKLCESLIRRAERSESKEQELEKQIAGIKKDYVEKVKAAETLKTENDQLTRLLTERNNKVGELNRKLSELSLAYDRQIEKYNELENRICEMTQENVTAITDCKDMKERLDRSEEELLDLQKKMSSLQERLLLGVKDKFGSTTEKTEKIFDDPDNSDPISEEEDEGEQKSAERRNYSAEEVTKRIKAKRNTTGQKSTGKKK